MPPTHLLMLLLLIFHTKHLRTDSLSASEKKANQTQSWHKEFVVKNNFQHLFMLAWVTYYALIQGLIVVCFVYIVYRLRRR